MKSPPRVKVWRTFTHNLSGELCAACWFDVMQKQKQSFSHYLNVLSIHIQQSLAEVHADGGLHPPWKLSGAQSVCEAGLPHPGVPDHHNLECPVAAPR